MRIVAKSGCPVTGHTHVNSGQSKRISYSRSGFGLGNVSSVLVGADGIAGSYRAYKTRARHGIVEGRARHLRGRGEALGDARDVRRASGAPAWLGRAHAVGHVD